MVATPTSDNEDVESNRPLLDPTGNPNRLPEFRALVPIYLRSEPRITSEKTGEVVKPGQTFRATDIVTVTLGGDETTHWDHVPYDEACFINLGKDRGWALSRNLMTDRLTLEEYEEHPGCRWYLRKGFQSHTYELLIGVIILINAIAIGWEIDHHEQLSDAAWQAVNWTFAVIYIAEMTLKLIALGPVHFVESRWNVFDLAVTCVTVLGDLIPLVVGFGHTSVISAVAPVLRLLRLLRLAKLFRELRTLMRSFMGSLSALFWIAVFTVLWFYISAIICVVFVGQKRWLSDKDTAGAKEIRAKFRTIPLSMYTLFEVMTLEGWVDVVSPLVHHHPLLVAFFLLFLFVTAFFLMNLVTAVVVDRTLQAQEHDQQIKTAASEEGKDKSLIDLRKHLTRRNSGNDTLRRDDFRRWSTEDAFVKDLFEKLDWDHSLNESACAALDEDLSGTISIDKLTRLIANNFRALDMMAMVKMQLDIAQRMERQQLILRDLLVQSQQPGSTSSLTRMTQRGP